MVDKESMKRLFFLIVSFLFFTLDIPSLSFPVSAGGLQREFSNPSNQRSMTTEYLAKRAFLPTVCSAFE